MIDAQVLNEMTDGGLKTQQAGILREVFLECQKMNFNRVQT